MSFLTALLAEPPFRRLVQVTARVLPFSQRKKDYWQAAERPPYLCGLIYAADQALREGRDAITAIEFGVAEGYGLLTLQRHAAAVERETGVRILVVGFDAGTGLPSGSGDYRDHCDWWRPGDYRSDVASLKRQLDPSRTTLVLGDVADTVSTYSFTAPLGFVSYDLDLWSSTKDALRVLIRADAPKLRRVALYFDDLAEHYNHAFAGELLAIEEFNASSATVKIDIWRGVQDRPFHEASWLRGMYLAHDLEAISAVRLTRAAVPTR